MGYRVDRPVPGQRRGSLDYGGHFARRWRCAGHGATEDAKGNSLVGDFTAQAHGSFEKLRVLMGENTEEVLTGLLGYTWDEVVALKDKNVIL